MPKKCDSKELTSIEHGEFDTAALQQELTAALEEDRLYRVTDSMKKRAIHTAANYDEFKVARMIWEFELESGSLGGSFAWCRIW